MGHETDWAPMIIGSGRRGRASAIRRSIATRQRAELAEPATRGGLLGPSLDDDWAEPSARDRHLRRRGSPVLGRSAGRPARVATRKGLETSLVNDESTKSGAIPRRLGSPPPGDTASRLNPESSPGGAGIPPAPSSLASTAWRPAPGRRPVPHQVASLPFVVCRPGAGAFSSTRERSPRAADRGARRQQSPVGRAVVFWGSQSGPRIRGASTGQESRNRSTARTRRWSD
jgi:hypothetical protein